MAGAAWIVVACCCNVRYGGVRQGKAGGVGTGGARWRKVEYGLVCPGKAGVVRHRKLGSLSVRVGGVRQVWRVQFWQGKIGYGEAGPAW